MVVGDGGGSGMFSLWFFLHFNSLHRFKMGNFENMLMLVIQEATASFISFLIAVYICCQFWSFFWYFKDILETQLSSEVRP